MSTSLPEALEYALKRCPALSTQSLDKFLGGLLDMDLQQLAQLPGSPGQVLAAQFSCYARSSVTLEEEMRRKTDAFQFLADALRRLPAAKPATRRRKSGAHTSRAEAAGG